MRAGVFGKIIKKNSAMSYKTPRDEFEPYVQRAFDLVAQYYIAAAACLPTVAKEGCAAIRDTEAFPFTATRC
ncbi:hypothetical protein [Ruegeria arenilitoris]|uniref:hypothetical protein n=1 Tax=Ruegeria arenilitoris TaxID=1173585 RepID=UPI0014816927|nr:hypothetical protein [Ruegeria arenilitoris]